MNENEVEEYYLTVLLTHGGDSAWQHVAQYIEETLAHEIVPFQRSGSNDRADINLLEQQTDECAFAIIVVTGDDVQPRSREKLLHEIGYCQGTFGRENVLVLKQEGVEEFTDLGGVVYVPFSRENIKGSFTRIQAEIEAAIDRFEDDEEVDDDE